MAAIDSIARKTLKERLVTVFINKFVGIANKNVSIADLQKKHGAYESKVVRLTVTDVGKSWHFRVADGKLEYVEAPKEVDGGIEITTDAIFALVRAKQKWMNPATGAMVEKPFTPIHAIQMGWVRYWGQAASNDVLLLARRIYTDVFPQMQDALGDVPAINGG